MGFELTGQDLKDLARGAAFLGTGGGGDPYVGRLMVEQALAEGGHLTLISPEEVPDDAFVIPTAMMGAPTVLVEKIPAGHEARSEEHTSELQSQFHLVCRLLLEKKKQKKKNHSNKQNKKKKN